MELDVIYNEDCLEGMRRLSDKSVDLVLTDPPYGQNIAKYNSLSIPGAYSKPRKFKPSTWDEKIPDKVYFDEILRVSKNQIIWGGNFFTHFLPPSKCWLVWYKKENLPGKFFADCELAWTSFNRPAMVFSLRWHGFIRDSKEPRVPHPTQKPLKLFKWCLIKFTKKGDIVLDPFMGSGTTAVACKELGRHYIGFEINKEYCEIAKKRLAQL